MEQIDFTKFCYTYSISIAFYLSLLNHSIPYIIALLLFLLGIQWLILVDPFKKLNTFRDKVSRNIYLKIDEIKQEYFNALRKNWNADKDLYF